MYEREQILNLLKIKPNPNDSRSVCPLTALPPFPGISLSLTSSLSLPYFLACVSLPIPCSDEPGRQVRHLLKDHRRKEVNTEVQTTHGRETQERIVFQSCRGSPAFSAVGSE